MRFAVAFGLAVAAVATPVAGAYVFDASISPAQRFVGEFTDALDRGDLHAAAEMTTYPSAAERTFTAVFNGLHADSTDFSVSQFVNIDADSGFFTVDADWALGGGRSWDYSVQGGVRNLATGWRIVWDPSVIVPDLRSGGSVKRIRTDAPAPIVRDVSGDALLKEQPVHVVDLDPTKTRNVRDSATRLADVIDVVAPLVTADSLTAQLARSHGRAVTAVRLRDDDFAVLEPLLDGIDGVVSRTEPRLVMLDRRLDTPLLEVYRQIWQHNRDKTQGWAISLTTPGAGARRLVGEQGPAGPDITATLDQNLQLAALDAVVSVGGPATIVAIRPSTGEIVAVAQNSYANAENPNSFATPVPLGSGADILKAADGNAAALGIGDRYSVPGVTAKSGSRTSLSPLDMARLAGLVSAGQLPGLTVAADTADVAPPIERLSPAVNQRIREVFKKSMSTAAAYPVQSFGEVSGFVGKAISASGHKTQWFLGSRGDLAVAVVIENPEMGDAAAKMTAMMLRGIGSAQA